MTERSDLSRSPAGLDPGWYLHHWDGSQWSHPTATSAPLSTGDKKPWSAVDKALAGALAVFIVSGGIVGLAKMNENSQRDREACMGAQASYSRLFDMAPGSSC